MRRTKTNPFRIANCDVVEEGDRRPAGINAIPGGGWGIDTMIISGMGWARFMYFLDLEVAGDFS